MKEKESESEKIKKEKEIMRVRMQQGGHISCSVMVEHKISWSMTSIFHFSSAKNTPAY
jgi:hypothetical protein